MRSTVGEDTVLEAPPTGEYKLVPFEMKTVDDRFLVEAAMIKDLSPLDACHNRVTSLTFKWL